MAFTRPFGLGLGRNYLLKAVVLTCEVVGEDALSALTGGSDGGRELDRSEGEKEGGSEEAIHFEKHCNIILVPVPRSINNYVLWVYMRRKVML